MNKETASQIDRFHLLNNDCTKCMVFKRNGKTKEWKRDTERFSIPVRYGLYIYTYITETTDKVHTDSDCLVCMAKEKGKDGK